MLYKRIGRDSETPKIRENFFSNWVQYSILLKNAVEYDRLQAHLIIQFIFTVVLLFFARGTAGGW